MPSNVLKVELYLLRHGDAVEQGYADFDRPLTLHGERSIRVVARSIVAMGFGIDKILTSPLVRAKQTADLVVEVLGTKTKVLETRNLIVGTDPLFLMKELNQELNNSNILLVGHEPFLSVFSSILVFGSPAGKLMLKKAGLACVEADKPIGPRVGSLRSLLTFKQMEIMRG